MANKNLDTKDTDTTNNEFRQIEAALQMVVQIRNQTRCTHDSLQPLYSALDFDQAKLLAKLDQYIDFVDIYKIIIPPSQYTNVYSVLRWNLKHSINDISSFSLDFYNRARFQFDGQYIRAQYFYDFGLGIVLQLGGKVVGPLQMALAREEALYDFPFRNGDGWRLLSLFGGDTAADGPEWPGYSTIDNARDAYYREQEAKMMKALPPCESVVGTEPTSTISLSDLGDHDSTDGDYDGQLSPSETSFSIL